MELKKILPILKINFLVFFFSIIIIELIFGYWLKENHFSHHMRGKRLQKIEKRLKKQRLNSDYIVRESDWTAALPVAQGTQLAQRSQTPLPPTPNVSQQTIAQVPQRVGATGLTATETALLSNEEKAMKLRQRGMV